MDDSLIIVRQVALQEAVQKHEAVYTQAVDQGTTNAATTDASGLDPYQKARFLAAWNNGMGQLNTSGSSAPIMTTAQNGIASRIQSSLVEFAQANGQLQVVTPAQEIVSGDTAVQMAQLLEVKFDNFDWLGWMGMAYLFIFKPDNAPWMPPPTVPDMIGNKAVVAVFGDWGTGRYGAPFIATQIRRMDRCDVALHLGDTYYAGRANEISRRLTMEWPNRTGTINRTLNGNHEMYSGGVSYFAALADSTGLFKQSSSCFAMQNDNWLLLGLDSSYVDADIDAGQVAWITSMVQGDAGKNKKVILFSHHQLYSKYDNISHNVQAALGPLLAEKLIYGWFFGHEHRMVIFEPHSQWGVRARCVGNGGFPEFRKQKGDASDPLTWINLAEDNTTHVPAAKSLDGANRFVAADGGNPGAYVPHAFMYLDFDGDRVFETYVDPDGNTIRAREEM
jgi:hypothetical protein